MIAITTLLVMLVVQTATAQVHQLSTVQRLEEASGVEPATAEQLLEKEKGKQFVVEFLTVSSDTKFQMTTSRYREFRGSESLKRAFDKEAYFKIDFRKVDLFDGNEDKPKRMTIKADIYWFLEGYEGVQTFHFALEKQNDRWLLDRLVH